MVWKEIQSRSPDNGGPVYESDERLVYKQESVRLYLDHKNVCSGVGDLYLSSYALYWLNNENVENGYTIPIIEIGLHAMVIEDRPSIYCQFDEDADKANSPKECNFVVNDGEALANLYKAFCECAELNPRPPSDDDNDSLFDFTDIHDNDDERVADAPNEQ